MNLISRIQYYVGGMSTHYFTPKIFIIMPKEYRKERRGSNLWRPLRCGTMIDVEYCIITLKKI